MNLAAFQSTISQKLKFQFQEIVGLGMNKQNWQEMLYRPQNMMGNQSVEHFFKALSTQQKVDLDIQIFDQLPKILEQKPDSKLSVNLMPISLLSADFKKNLLNLINHNLVDPRRLCIEIIEIHSMPPLCSSTIELLQVFRANGGWIALDDFGSGFAHWELLQMGLIDVIKVANQNLNIQNETSSFTCGLAKFANSMGITTVLEGVETRQDFEKGVNQGFQNFQGWYFK